MIGGVAAGTTRMHIARLQVLRIGVCNRSASSLSQQH